MFARLLMMWIAFHSFNAFVLLIAFRVSRHRYHEEPSIRPRISQIVADAIVLVTVALMSASLVASLAEAGAFGFVNLVSSWIFGEGVIAAAAAAVVFRRAGLRGHAAFFGISAATLIVVFVDAHYIEPRVLEVSRHDIVLGSNPSARMTLVRSMDSTALKQAHSKAPREIRIAHISDIQTARIGAHEREAFEEIRRLQPDMVVFTGDYLQPLPGYESLRAARVDFRRLLNSLPVARYGSYAVKGDAEDADWTDLFANTPVLALSDSSVRVRLDGTTASVAAPDSHGGLPFVDDGSRAISLVGLSASTARGGDRRGLRALVASLPRDDVKIVMGHSPDFVMGLEERTVDLALGGHTHGGQIALPLFGPLITLSRLPREMARGVHSWNGTPLHVSAGVGMERRFAPQLRFLCRPEICLLRLVLPDGD